MKKDELIAQTRICEPILTYGVDAHSLSLTSPTAAMNPVSVPTVDVFYTDLYIANTQLESEINSHVDTLSFIEISASAGSGKSTILHYILRDHVTRRGLPYVLLDFKVVYFGVKSPSISDHLNNLCRSTFREFLQRQVVREHMRPISGGMYSLLDLCAVLMDRRFDRVVSPAVLSKLEEAQQHWPESNPNESMHERFAKLRDANSEKFLSLFAIASQLLDSLTLKDLAFSIAEFKRQLFQEEYCRKPIFALDNADAIPDSATWEQLQGWLDGEAGTLKDIATVLFCLRKTTNHLNREGIQGRGGLYVANISITPEGSVGSAKQTPAAHSSTTNYFDDTSDYYSEAGLSDTEKRVIAYDRSIFERRLEFIRKKLNASAFGGDCFSVALREILSIRPVEVELSMQTIQNRRLLLGAVVRFLEYVSKDLDLDWDMIGRRMDGSARPASHEEIRGIRGSAIKSLFYKMLGNPQAVGGNSLLVLDPKLVDPMNAVASAHWIGGNRLKELDSPQIFENSLGLLTLLAIRRNTKDGKVHVRDLHDLLDTFGFAPDSVNAMLGRFIRSTGSVECPFFDIDHFHAMLTDGENPLPEYRVFISSRGSQVCNVSVIMFNYICERIRNLDPSLKLIEESTDNLLRGLVDAQVVRRLPNWIARLITLEMLVLDRSIQGPNISVPLSRYSGMVDLRSNLPHAMYLMSGKIVQSGISYLEFQTRHVLTKSDRNTMEVYSDALNDLKKILSCLTHIINKVSKGDPWGVPRGQALDFRGYFDENKLRIGGGS